MAKRHDRGTGGPALPVLMFHALEEGPAVISFPPRVFRQALARLRAEGYQSVPLTEAVASLRRGAPLPERAVVITFDDGYRSVYQEAFPALQEHEMTATVFLTVGRPGVASSSSGRLPDVAGRPMLGWAEIREIHRAGIAIGAHTLTHPDLTRLSPEEAEVEMRDSRAAIEDAVGASVESFAYPYGRYDGRTREIARRYFACACSDRLGLVRSDSDPYALERVEMYYLRTNRLVGLVASQWLAWYLRARSLPRTTRRLASRAAGGT